MQQSSSLPIAMFDSGVGGLTVFKAISRLLPHENLLYLGDTARVPYGTKSRETIIRYTLHAARKLVDFGAKMLVVACNTATSASLPILREKLAPIPVLGVVEPGAQAAVAATRNRRIAVIATEGTIASEAYQNAIGRLLPEAVVIGKACTLFVALAEEGWVEGIIAESAAALYLRDIFEADPAPDTLVLGCTHFPLLLKTLRKVVGPDVHIVDSAEATAVRVKNELEKLKLLKSGGKSEHRFYTTDNCVRFMRSGSLFLGEELNQVELVDL